MATSTELLRAAEHMRACGVSDAPLCGWYFKAADALESEASRLQAIEAQQDGTCEVCRGVGIRTGVPSWNDCVACGGHGRVVKPRAQPKARSWPEGWPPFAVLRRAYSATGMHHAPSTKWCDSKSPVIARRTRERWKQALDALKWALKHPSTP